MSEREHSPSSLKLADACRRAWALCYVDKIRKPDLVWEVIEATSYGNLVAGQRSAALGTRVHLYAEWYLTGADVNDAVAYGPRRVIDWSTLPGRVLETMLPHLPPAGSVPRENAEADVRLEFRGVRWKGVIDVVRSAAAAIMDHKSTRSIREYALLSHDVALKIDQSHRSLKNDLQAAIYALWLLSQPDYADADSVLLQWTYGETDKSRRSLKVLQDMPRSHAESIVAAANTRAQTLNYTTSDEAPVNTLSCGDYGGCWYRGRHCFAKRDYGRLLVRMQLEEKRNAEMKPLKFNELRAAQGKANDAVAKAPPGRVAKKVATRKPAPEPEPEETEETEETEEETETEAVDTDAALLAFVDAQLASLNAFRKTIA